MAASAMNRVIQHLRKAALLREGVDLTDAQLLDSYVSRRDAAALEVLVYCPSRNGNLPWRELAAILSWRNIHDSAAMQFSRARRLSSAEVYHGSLASLPDGPQIPLG